MLTPVTPNAVAAATTIKTHGSETRTASGQNMAETQAAPQPTGHTPAIGMDAGSILSSVNAEAATAGNRTILQTLAMAVAAQINITRQPNETMDAFFLRIADALEQMPPDRRVETEARAGLKALRVPITALATALRQPDGALAARLSAMAETPLATPLKTAAQSATTSYLQASPGSSRAAETLAMVAQARTNAKGNGLFSSTTAPLARDTRPIDARSLQTQLKSLFEPGVAETRVEIARKIEVPNALILGANDEKPEAPEMADAPEQIAVSAGDDVPDIAAETVQQQDGNDQAATPSKASGPDEDQANAQNGDAKPADEIRLDEQPLDAGKPESSPADPMTGETPVEPIPERKPIEARLPDAKSVRPQDTVQAQARPEMRAGGAPIPQNSNVPSAAEQLRSIARDIIRERVHGNVDLKARLDGGDRRMQTMLAFRGLEEVVTTLPATTGEELPNPANLKARQDKAVMTPSPLTATTDEQQVRSEDAARKSMHPINRQQQADPASEELDDTVAPGKRPGGSEPLPAVRIFEQEKAAILKAATTGLDPVPFAYATLQPAKEEFKPEVHEEDARHGDGDESEDREWEDEDTRRERLAREAIDELLRVEPEAEPEVRITRDSSQADRAYALYQRMAGF